MEDHTPTQPAVDFDPIGTGPPVLAEGIASLPLDHPLMAEVDTSDTSLDSLGRGGLPSGWMTLILRSAGYKGSGRHFSAQRRSERRAERVEQRRNLRDLLGREAGPTVKAQRNERRTAARATHVEDVLAGRQDHPIGSGQYPGRRA